MSTTSPGTSTRPLRVAICGGGATAALLLGALSRVRNVPLQVTVFEPRQRLGVGVAYSTPVEAHLLNTRACTMSVTTDPNDFVDWLRSRHPRKLLNWNGDDFAPRAYFAEYVQVRLAAFTSTPGLQTKWVRSAVDCLIPQGNVWHVVPASGTPVEADIVLLATGNEAPKPLAADLPPRVRSLVIEDPWDVNQKAAIPPNASVVLVGSGLTAVDVVLELLERRHTGPIYAVSRHALLPRSHGPLAATSDGLLNALPAASVREVVRHVRNLCRDDTRGDKWRRAFTELRGMAPLIWKGWPTAERRRFLRHVRPFWEVHRHRLPVAVHRRIERALSQAQLQLIRGRVRSLEQTADGNALQVQVESHGHSRLICTHTIINCTGPQMDVRASANPLLRALVSDGLAKPDALGLGLAVDAKFRVVADNGTPHSNLFALGALTRGVQWEVTALAEIREQVNAVVRHVIQGPGSHRVEAEEPARIPRPAPARVPEAASGGLRPVLL